MNAQNEPPAVPQLTDDALRRIVIRLYDLGSAWATIDAQTMTIEKMNQLSSEEKAFHERELQLEQQKTAIAERERDLERSRADFAEAKQASLKRGKSAGCIVMKIFTAGLKRCG